MFEKNMRLAYLIDFYIDLLDAHSQSILRAYYDDDLSLAERASGEGISRQGIRHIIKKSEELILFYEEKLGLARKHEILEEAAEKLSGIKKTLSDSSLADKEAITSEIDGVLTTIIGKGVENVPESYRKAIQGFQQIQEQGKTHRRRRKGRYARG